ncbi:Leucine rich repeat protein [Spraguea lophii 42_110]|uniref:Leucine rich repeat protein n=1 Tax=Spraguea lophii (strain 42_110) TaxID=1358809 RepID=S7W8V1_SPRLO|nr:Leucine rich repeat protein [Spraguea lophii 42_110]
MGNIQSKSKKYIIAKGNCSAPEILRLLSLDDHLFPYEKIQVQAHTKMKLVKDLCEFNNYMVENIKKYSVKNKYDEKVNESGYKTFTNNDINVEKRGGNKNDIANSELVNIVQESLSPRTFPLSSTELRIISSLLEPETRLNVLLHESKALRNIYSDIAINHSELYLCRQFIIEVNSNIMFFKKLKIVQLCCNYLSEIPKEIGELENLNILILSRNRIKKLPREIGKLYKLKELSIKENYLKSLPLEITSLKKLEILNIDSNKFTSLPTYIGKLGNLKQLSVNDNPIQDIPIEIINLIELQELNAECCNFNLKKYQMKNNISPILKHSANQLKEICCRKIIFDNILIPKTLLNSTKKFMKSVKECSFCKGPYFTGYKTIVPMHVHNQDMPVSYRMCKYHFNSTESRKEKLMWINEPTTPYKRINAGKKDIGVMFNKYEYDLFEQLQSNEKYIEPGNLAFEDFE